MKKYVPLRNSRKSFYFAALIGSLSSLPAFAQPRDSVSRYFPIYDNGGKADLTIDPERFVSQMSIVDRYFSPDSCAIVEGVVGASGYRRLLRFDTVIINGGDGDLIVGDRADPDNPYASYFKFNECHGHYHINGFSRYDLLTTEGALVVRSTKMGFCFQDDFKYTSENPSNGYYCEHQGITSGWGDWYYKQLGGQWIDITGVPEGDYIVRVTINPSDLDDYGNPVGPRKKGHSIFDEGHNDYPNEIETTIHIPDPRNKVDIE